MRELTALASLIRSWTSESRPEESVDIAEGMICGPPGNGLGERAVMC